MNKAPSLVLLIALIQVIYQSTLLANAQDSTTASNDSKPFNETLNEFAKQIPTSCVYSWPEMYGASDDTLEQREYSDNTLISFDMTSQLNLAHFLDLGFQPILTAVTGCATLQKPIHDLGITVAIRDLRSGNVSENTTDFTAFGNITQAQAEGRFCKVIELALEDKIIEADIFSSRNEVTKLLFITEQGKVLDFGSQLPNSKIDRISFKDSNDTIAGFRGVLSHTADDSYLSQISFVVWTQECVQPLIALYVLAGLAVLIIIILSICCCCCFKKKKSNENKIGEETTPDQSARKMTIDLDKLPNAGDCELEETTPRASGTPNDGDINVAPVQDNHVRPASKTSEKSWGV